MSLGCNYSLVQKLDELKSGLLVFARIENFWSINNIDGKQYDSAIAKLKEKIEKEFDAKFFHHECNSFFILISKQDALEELHSYLIDAGSKFFNGYLVASIGYTKFDNEMPNQIIYKALCAHSFTQIKINTRLSYKECENKIEELELVRCNSTELHNAMKSDNLELVFQPIVDVQNSEILFHEALLRIKGRDEIYNHILAAEKTGLIFAIDEFVIKRAVQIMQNTPSFRLSVNVSAISINNSAWVEKLFAFFKSIPHIASKIIIEITENHILNDYTGVFDFIFKLKSICCEIAIDDFGDNLHLPFLKLEKLAVNFIKLDSCFAKEIILNKNTEIFVDAISKISANSEIKVIAEFIESKEIFEKFKRLGIKYMQGNCLYPASTKIIN